MEKSLVDFSLFVCCPRLVLYTLEAQPLATWHENRSLHRYPLMMML